MKIRIKSLFLTLLVLICSFVSVQAVFASANPVAGQNQLKIQANGVIAADAKTGQILYQKNIDQPMAIASVSKLMTIYITHQEINQGKLKWSSKVKITKDIAALSRESGVTNVNLVAGKSYSVQELTKAALVGSANAAAMALGNKIAQTPAKFAQLMNHTAKSIGLQKALFYNACGLTNKMVLGLGLKNVKSNAENLMTTQDVAILTSKLLKDFPSITKITSMPNTKFAGQSVAGHNQLLGNQPLIAKGVVVDGLKTGTSDKAGACFVGTAEKQGKRIITVVLHASNKNASDPARFVQTEKLMHYIFTEMVPKQINMGSSLNGVASASVPNGKRVTVPLVVSQNTWVWVNKSLSPQISGKFLTKTSKLSAPVFKGTHVGQAHVLVNSKSVSYLRTLTSEISLKTKSTMPKANIFVRVWRAITSIF